MGLNHQVENSTQLLSSLFQLDCSSMLGVHSLLVFPLIFSSYLFCTSSCYSPACEYNTQYLLSFPLRIGLVHFVIYFSPA